MPKNLLPGLTLSARLLLVTLAGIALLTAVVLTISIRIAEREMLAQALEREDTNMRVAWEVLHEHGFDIRAAGDKLLIGGRAVNGTSEIVDRVASLVGGTATLFRGETRVSTNVEMPDGTRALGTLLGPGPVFDAVLVAKVPYRGEAQILGKPYLTAYDPLIDLDGTVVGILYVGLPKSVFSALVDALAKSIIIASGSAALVAAAMSYLLIKLMLQPLRTLRVLMDRLSRGERDITIDGLDRRDEIGAMAAAVHVFKHHAVALDAAAAGFAIWDQNDRLTLLNQGFQTLVSAGSVSRPGITFEAMLRQAAKTRIHHDKHDSAEAWIEKRLRQHKAPSSTHEHQLVDGTWLRVEERRTSDGGSLTVYLDITELKRRETELKAALLEAEAANHAKSQFLANMSHELRTPLNAIIGFSEMIRDEIMGPVGQPAYQGYAGDIHQSGLHLLEVVNGILDLAKAEAGALTLALDEVDLGELLSQVFRMVTPQANQAGVDLLMETPPGAAIIRTDERKLRQALLNLAGNAVKFTPAGGHVAMTACVTETVARIAVDDTGIGIAPSDIPTVMRPFGQVDNAMSRKYEGTGLGLPLALRLVEHLGGTLVITSEIGRGTNALVTLPIGDAVPRAA